MEVNKFIKELNKLKENGLDLSVYIGGQQEADGTARVMAQTIYTTGLAADGDKTTYGLFPDGRMIGSSEEFLDFVFNTVLDILVNRLNKGKSWIVQMETNSSLAKAYSLRKLDVLGDKEFLAAHPFDTYGLGPFVVCSFDGERLVDVFDASTNSLTHYPSSTMGGIVIMGITGNRTVDLEPLIDAWLEKKGN